MCVQIGQEMKFLTFCNQGKLDIKTHQVYVMCLILTAFINILVYIQAPPRHNIQQTGTKIAMHYAMFFFGYLQCIMQCFFWIFAMHYAMFFLGYIFNALCNAFWGYLQCIMQCFFWDICKFCCQTSNQIGKMKHAYPG